MRNSRFKCRDEQRMSWNFLGWLSTKLSFHLVTKICVLKSFHLTLSWRCNYMKRSWQGQSVIKTSTAKPLTKFWCLIFNGEHFGSLIKCFFTLMPWRIAELCIRWPSFLKTRVTHYKSLGVFSPPDNTLVLFRHGRRQYCHAFKRCLGVWANILGCSCR